VTEREEEREKEDFFLVFLIPLVYSYLDQKSI
jgi:hypothetical protein